MGAYALDSSNYMLNDLEKDPKNLKLLKAWRIPSWLATFSPECPGTEPSGHVNTLTKPLTTSTLLPCQAVQTPG